MKNAKKLIVSVFALSALMLGACSGSKKTDSSSTSAPADTSSVPAESTSQPAESSSAPEETSSTPADTSSEDQRTVVGTLTLGTTAHNIYLVEGYDGGDVWEGDSKYIADEVSATAGEAIKVEIGTGDDKELAWCAGEDKKQNVVFDNSQQGARELYTVKSTAEANLLTVYLYIDGDNYSYAFHFNDKNAPAEVTEHTVTLNEAPTAGRVVVVHAWDLEDGFADVVATVEDADVTFDLQSNDWAGYLIAELKEGKTFNDFSFFDPEDQTKIIHDWNVVARQTDNVTDMSATTASWQTVAPATEYAFTLDSSATTAFAGRTFFVCSWKEGYLNVYDYFTASKNAKIATAADGFLVGVLKEGKTAEDGVGDGWANVDKQSSNVTTNPTTSVEIYAAGGAIKVGLDGETPSAAYTVDVYLKVPGAADWNATGKVVYAHVWDGGDNDQYVATVYDDAYEWKKANEQHYTVPVEFLPTNIQFILCSADQVPDIPTAWPGDDKVEAKTQAAVEAWAGGPGANLTTLG